MFDTTVEVDGISLKPDDGKGPSIQSAATPGPLRPAGRMRANHRLGERMLPASLFQLEVVGYETADAGAEILALNT
jgi:hypothetical protein